ncbi:putative pectinesterase/pectinesterase inhibitor 21 [Sesamum angolense]|uniref:Pectinesterase n=1 Tax=Sesamum angolense TaxID=2727404 RepID=A0AAE2BKA0_9LAMI|nr:putative pectinesterase/pectinesterase inhibitor 21 [Sesamum angolense]
MAANKGAVAGLAAILVVAMVVAVAVGVTRKNGEVDSGSASNGNPQINAGTTKAVQSICAPTDYKDTCEKGLSHANTTNPKELIKAAFDFTLKNIGDVVKNSPLFKEASHDKSTKEALEICQQVLDIAIDDLKMSFDSVEEFDVVNASEYVEDLKTWLSAVITNQETCIDAFDNTTGDTGEKMKNLLKTAREMSSNGLAMVTDMSSFLTSLQLGNVAARKLLSKEGRFLYGGDPTDYAPGEEPTSFVSNIKRSLIALKHNAVSEKIGYGGDPTDYAPGEEPPFHLDSNRRHLLSATSLKPNAVVSQDGSGQFNTISAAIATVPLKNDQTFVIHVKAGVYKEQVLIPKHMNKIVLIGDGPLKTRVTGRLNFAEGVKTYHTATVAVNADEFFAKDIGFENTAGALGHQAVALRVSGDRAVFYNVHIDGYQDTLYAHTYRQYYRDCSISGTIDFIFGDAQALFQNCKFVVRKPGPNQACMITAQGRIERHSLGVTVIQNGDIVGEPALLQASPPHKVYLGRPWKQLSRTIIMQSNIGGFIAPEGWSPWAGTFALDTLYYAEYQNRGPGSDLKARVTWKGIQKLSPQMAESWTGGKLFGGDEWIRSTGSPYVPSMMQV